MKAKFAFQVLLFGSTLLAAQTAHAQLTWDANGTATGQTNGGGVWLNPNLWWNGTSNQDWASNSDAIFGGPNTAGGTVSLASPTAVGSLTFNTFTGTYALGSTGQTLTINSGITNNSASGALTISSPVTLGGAQTWGGASTGALAVSNGINNNGHTLTLGVGGSITMSATATVISGGGGLTKNGSGTLVLGGGGTPPAHSYTGPTSVNGGVVMFNANKTAGNMTLNGGMLTDYYRATTAFTSGLGTGNNQIQIYGDSGFGGGNGNSTWRIGASGSVLKWGDTVIPQFNPTSLKFLTSADNMGSSIYGQVTLDNGLDLNGAARTVQVLAAAGTNAITASWGKVSGVISGSGGSLIKTGGGNLILSAANTYGGGTTINQGNLRFPSLAAMPPAGNVAVNTGATLTVEAGGAGDWTSGTSGVGTLGGLFSGLGGAGTSTVSFSGNATLGLEMSGNITHSADIPNLGDNLAITKTGGSSLTLSGNNSYSGRTWVHTGTLSFNSIANVGGGTSALGAPATVPNGTISIGSDGATVTLAYSGSGHSSDRLINLAAASGTATLDASGSGPLTLTSSLTAAAGAKTLTLTGTNTAANTLGTTSIPGLAEVLTITKSGAGTWRINGFSSPKNAWSVTAGTLVAAGAITTGDQNVTVSGGTLAGVGPITLQSSKSLTVQAAGSLSPGNSGVGTMAVTGILNISAMAGGTGKLNFEMAAPAASDKIAVTGTASIGSGQLGLNDFVFTDLGGMTASTYVLITTTGGITGTLDPANRLGSIGSISGALQINGTNLEFTVDSDLDGLPDSYELANTSPSSPTSLDPNADLENGGTGDGLTNLQEYLLGTSPNNPDTDADGLMDGVETNTGTWLSSSNTGTNPLVLDTDGDTLRDGYETKTGIFVSSTNTGTNPNLADTDADALTDNVETQTGTFVSKTNTGTNPNNADTDNDGAGDWYEVTASFTSPFLATQKPDIPYPLPDPDSSTGATNKKVKVYIMSGQSNMLGFGTVAGTGDGTLETMTRRQNKFPNLIDGSGNYIPRQDVRYRGLISGIASGPLAPGQGSNSGLIGPELGFGQVMGWYHDAPVLLIKPSIGNRGLGWDILPPGSPSYQYGGYQYAGYGQSPDKWLIGTTPTPIGWYAGKEFDRFFTHESEWAQPDTAATNVVDILDNWGAEYGNSGKPFAGQDFEIAGFVWWQGDRDRYDMGHATRYEQNLVKLITSLRSYYTNRYPGKVVANAPFVLATLGQTAIGDTSNPADKAILDAQLAVDGAAGNHPQFAGNVKTVYAHPLSEGGASNSHYNNRAGTYLLVGDALGRAMVDLESATLPGNTFATWIAGYPSVPPSLAGFSQDADGDGIKNGAENFFGTNPGIGSSGLVSGASSGNTFTFTHPQNATPATGVTAAYRWSKDLVSFRSHGESDGAGTTVNFNAITSAGVTTVTATVTGTPAAKLFVDVKVTQN